MNFVIKSVGCLLLCCCVKLAVASTTPDFESWKQQFRQQALAEGVSEETLNTFIPQMDLLPAVVQSDRKQPEFISTFWDYVDKRLTPTRLDKGHTMMKRYPTWLKRLENQFGVPGQYLVAFWGLETNYGDTKGKTDILDALATLAYDKRRRSFFTRELIAFLKILESEHWSHVSGSWAGAFGHFQFMPTTFMAYAVDADNNGARNIINNMPDAFASAANYLHKMGWKYDEPWGHEVALPKNIDWDMVHDKKGFPVQDWKRYGYQLATGKPFPMEEHKIIARLVLPMGLRGPAFLVYPNFYRIMKWNKSELYALTVAFLADILKGEWPGIQAQRNVLKFSYMDVKKVQESLSELGYYRGTIDGKMGPKMRQAVQEYQKARGLPEDGYLSDEVIRLLVQ
ncbi:MAG: lytic murein transglycosylase [Alphaproteobacteria bacterium]|nr:lytic murein transglycosylase [Alphaproteobacteria bacterium]